MLSLPDRLRALKRSFMIRVYIHSSRFFFLPNQFFFTENVVHLQGCTALTIPHCSFKGYAETSFQTFFFNTCAEINSLQHVLFNIKERKMNGTKCCGLKAGFWG